MALEKIGVEAVVEGLSSFKRGIKQIDDGVDGVGKSSKKGAANVSDFFGSFLKSGIAIGAVTAIGAAVKQFADESILEFKAFERQSAEVFTLLPGLTEQATDQMKADMLSFSAEVGRTTDETVPALYQAISAGVPQENVFDFMKIASDAALGGVTDLETAVDGITSVTNAYGQEAISAAEASDVMFTAVRLGKTNFEQLSSSLFNVIPTAASLGVKFEDVAASLAALTAQGTPTSVATTQLRSAFVEASKSGTKLDSALRKLTGQGFADLIASGRTSQDIFLELRQSMPEQEFRDLFSSVEASNAILGITSETAQGIISDFGTLEDAMGATAAAADTMAGTLEFAESKLAATNEVLKIQTGQRLNPAKLAWTNLKLAVSEYFAEDAKVHNQILKSTDALAEYGITGVAAEKAIGALGEGTIYWKDSLVDAETLAFRTEAATQLLAQGWRGSASDLAELVKGQANSNQAIAEGGEAAESYDQALLKVSLSAAEAAQVHEILGINLEYTREQTMQMIAAEQELADKMTQKNSHLTEGEAAVRAANAANAEYFDSLQAQKLAEEEATAALALYNQELGKSFANALTATEAGVSLEMQLFNEALAAGANATELAILAANTGEFTAQQIEAAFQAAVMEANINALVEAMTSGAITADEATLALQQLKENEGLTAEQAIGLAESISGANAELDAMNGAAIDAAGSINNIPDYKETTYRFKVVADPVPSVVSGPSGKGPGGTQNEAFQMGGFTGRGPVNGLAGAVHFEEVVLPKNVLSSGPNAILDFVNSNLPGGIPMGTSAQPAVNSSVANNSSSTKMINLSFPNTQINNGMDVRMLGEFIVQTVAGAI